jgi:hypothetical protein
MAVLIARTLDFNNSSRINNLPDGVNPQDPATVAQLTAVQAAIAWKDSVRSASTANVTISGPGASIDGVALTSGDRVLLKNQTAPAENGIWIFNGAAVAMTRSLDANTSLSLEAAVTTVEEGTTNSATTWRQTSVNFTLGAGAIAWASFGTAAGAATETTAGIAEIATQAETDGGVSDTVIVTPLKLGTSVFATRKFAANVGDASATSFLLTHSFNTFDVTVEVFRNSGNRDSVLCEVQRTSVNAVTVVFDVAPTTNQFRVLVRA